MHRGKRKEKRSGSQRTEDLGIHGHMNWHHASVELAYHFRGWLATWEAQMRAFQTSDLILLGVVVLVFGWSAVSINRR